MSTFDEDFLSSVLTPQEFAHYRRFLGDALIPHYLPPEQEESWQWQAKVIRRERPAPLPVAAVTAGHERRGNEMTLIGSGPDRCTSDQRLARRPEICWDVCGYYRRLGVPWTATRRQLRDAYIMLGAALDGRGNASLAYALSQLLDEDIRREYDAVPLGGLFLKDQDVVTRLKAAAQRAASRMAAQGYTSITEEDVLSDWGLRLTPPGADDAESAGERRTTLPPAAPSPWLAVWSWYIEARAVHDGAWALRAEHLGAWQQMLVRAFAARGMRVTFGVGLGASEGFSIRPSYNTGTLVILLGPDEPTQQMADDAADTWGLAPGSHAAIRTGS